MWWHWLVLYCGTAAGQRDVGKEAGATGYQAMLTAYTAVRDACIFPNDYGVTLPLPPDLRS